MSGLDIRALRELPEAELRTLQRHSEWELERRRLQAVSQELAEIVPTEDDLAYLNSLWADAYSGDLTEASDAQNAVRWLWACTVSAHDAQYDRAPTVAHVARQLNDALYPLLLGGGGEDTTDVRDLGEPPKFGGRGCTCEMYDDGGPESGPRLGVDLSEVCPLHRHLLLDALDGPDWGGEVSTEDTQPLEAAPWPGEELVCEGHESTAGPIGNVTYCDGSCRRDKLVYEPTTTPKEIS
jgi:hypothetical protein